MPPRSGIRKHQRRDRDGDLLMGAVPRPTSAGSKSLTELRVTGWTDSTEIQKLTKFLERHAAKRTAGLKGVMIKRSRVAGETLLLSIRPEDVPAFSKINGFSFTSTHGSQKITITGPGIRQKSPNDSSATTPPPTEAAPLLESFLERRYDAEQKLLNLSSIASDEQVNAAGMFDSVSTQAKFIPALMVMVGRRLKTADEKRNAIHSVLLSNNNLPNLGAVKDLAFTLPHVKNLDLSGNQFGSTKDLFPWKNKLRDLEHLILSGNPFEASQAGWEREITGWYPRLRILNGQTVRTDDQIARLDAPKHTPIPSQTNLWLDGDQVAQNFVVDFIQGFDGDRNLLVEKYYDKASTFTMMVNTLAKGGAGRQHDRTPWDSYLPQSRNLKLIQGKRARFSRKYRGPEQIQKAWSSIPPTRHPGLDTDKYSMDCQPQPGLPDPSGHYPGGVTGLMVIVHGEYEEHRTAKGANEIVRRAFDRTFILGPGGPSGVRVVSDMCALRAAGGAPAWIPQGPAPIQPPAPSVSPALPSGLTPEQEAMVMHVHEATKLTLEMATQCLQAGNWDLDTAAQIFTSQKDQLPRDAFISS